MLPFLVTLLLLGFNLTSGSPLTYTECDVATNIVQVHSLTIPGDPLVLSSKSPLKLFANATLLKSVGQDANLAIDIYKKFDILGKKVWVHIPCIDDIGSCSRNFCDYVVQNTSSLACKVLKSMGKQCSCPFAPGQFVTNGFEIQVQLQNFPQAILDFGDGDIRVHAEVQSGSTVLYCIDVYATLELDQITLPIASNGEEEEDEITVVKEWNPFWNGWF